jgi:membrane-associated phospholipid phosphatase
MSQTPAKPVPPAPVVPVTVTGVANPFRNIVPNLGNDFKAMGSTGTLWIAGFGALTSVVVHNSNDERLHTWVSQQGDASSSSSVGNFLGDGVVQGSAAVAVWLGGGAAHNVKLQDTGADLVRAQVLNGVITQGLKLGFQRARPDGGTRAFPSGHTSATFATAAVIQSDYGIGAAVPLYALGGFVSWSRIRTNHHWLSDVVAGATIGIISGRASTRHHQSSWMLTPVKTTGGAALYLIKR